MINTLRTLLLIPLLMTLLVTSTNAEVMGWRGDGSGCYPTVNPPTHWGRISRDVAELSAQAGKPANDALPDKANAAPDGVLRHWLVLGPLPLADDAKTDEPIPDIAALTPEDGLKTTNLSWQAVTLDTDCMDLCQILKVPPDKKGFAAYAHTYIHSPSGRPVAFNLMTQGQGSYRVWLNGVQVYFSGKNVDMAPESRLVLNLKKGWNRLLILNAKTLATRQSWWIRGALFGDKGAEYDAHGIVWMTPTPSPGSSAPVIMGDRLFFSSESGSLTCVNKADGKPLWIRSLTYYDFATDEERKANPEIFAVLDPVAEKLKLIDQAEIMVPYKWPALEKDRRGSLENTLIRNMAKVSRTKYGPASSWGCEAGYTACNPVTDGERVYVLFGTGIIACYDRDGNRQWSRLLKHGCVEHGYTTSPLLIDGKLVVYFDNFNVLDAKTGAVLVERPHLMPNSIWLNHFHGTGCLLPAGSEKVIYYLNGEFRRLSDGVSLTLAPQTIAALKPENFTSLRANRIATPVSKNGIAYKIISNLGDVVAFKVLPLQGDTVTLEIVQQTPFNTDKFPYYYEPFYDATPLLYDGLLYCVNDFGVLTVVDPGKGEVVYQRLLDVDIFMPYNGGDGYLKGGASASPTLAGKYIYFFGNQGVCLVLEPGRTFKPVARNRVEFLVNADYHSRHQEATISAPIFEGGRLYYRGGGALYCIGQK
ncbi:MAG: PQQ-binding-like beta-propeller repeat protein [bacterium]